MMNYVSVLSVSKVCPPCDNELKADNIMEHYCASDFGKYQKFKRVKPAYKHDRYTFLACGWRHQLLNICSTG